jgi:hypothetical protein
VTVRRSASAGDKVAVLLRTALQDDRLSFRARGVLASVLSRPQDWTTSAARLARSSPTEGRDAIRTALIELESCGYLRRNRTQNERGQWEWHWDISDDPALFPPKPAVDPQVKPQVSDIPAGQTTDGSSVTGSAEPGEAAFGSPELGQGGAITGGRGTGGRSTGSRRNPPRPPDGVMVGADGAVIDAEIPLTAPTVIESVVEAYAAAYRRAGGVPTRQTRAVIARSVKRLITGDGVPADVVLAAAELAGRKKTKDLDSQLKLYPDASDSRVTGWNRHLVEAAEKLTPNVPPDDPARYAAERRAITRAAADGTLDPVAYAAGQICFTPTMEGAHR